MRFIRVLLVMMIVSSLAVPVMADVVWVNGSTTPAWQNTSMYNVSNNSVNVVIANPFTDYFTSNDLVGWTSLAGTWSGADGFLNVTVGANPARIYRNHTVFSNTTPFDFRFDYRNVSAILDKDSYIKFYYDTPHLTTGNGMQIWISNYAFRLQTLALSNIIVGDAANISAMIDGNWHTVRVNYNGAGTWTMYRDNILVGSGSSTLLVNSNGIQVYQGASINNVNFDNIRYWTTTSGNLTAWRDSGIGNEVYQTEIQMYGNYSACTGSNATRICDQYYGTFNTTNSSTWNNQTLTITTKYQDYFVNLTLLGDTTTTPQTVNIGHWAQAAVTGNTSNITSWIPVSLNQYIELFSTQLFSAVANQTITTWNWFMNGTNQTNNYDNFSYNFNTTGYYILEVNSTNINGTSNTILWNNTIKQAPEITISTVIT